MLMLNLESIAVSYGTHHVLSGLTLTLRGGVVAGLLGPNGCGKSTLVRSIAGAQRHHGHVSYGNRTGRALQDVTGYMPQEIPGHIALTAMESVLVSAQRGGSGWRVAKEDVERAYATLEGLGIGALANTYLGECSGGQRQLISLAQTLVHGPELVLLDEPTSALDLKHQVRVLRSVRQHVHGSHITVAEQRTTYDPSAGETESGSTQSRLAVVVLHDINLATRFCDEVLLMAAGDVVAQGPPEEVCTSENLSWVYDTEVSVSSDEDGVLTVVAR
ncbi:MAG: ABC transporter ATP-binding protein [Propionibacteriaceae bacterium]|nr:ABC transporter ATP-binding protein [Propionibacteriaceae bacterium]